MEAKGDHNRTLLSKAQNEQHSIGIEEMIAMFERKHKPLWRSNQERICIRKVHEKFHKMTEPSSYAPLMVSIGPFHRENESLKAMEECKLHYMSNILNRTRVENDMESITVVFRNCVESIGKMEQEIRQCYSETINVESREFLEMIVVDGLFIIELLQALAGTNWEHDNFLFHNTWGMKTLLWDLLVLENQIPIIVLERLFDLTAVEDKLKGMTFNRIALDSFKCNIKLQRDKNTVTKLQQQDYPSKGNVKHLLDLLANSLHPDLNNETGTRANQIKSSLCAWWIQLIAKLNNPLLLLVKCIITFICPISSSNHTLSGIVMPSATELERAGVNFERGSEDGSFLDIKFCNGVMNIPPIVIGDSTGRFFRNLIASEQYLYRIGSCYHITSYAVFMDSLVNSSKDVALLRNQGIITHCLGSDEDVSNLFNKLCCDIYLVSDYYSGIHQAVNKYYSDSWNFCKATFRRKYFDNPWSGISVFAAAILLILSLISTTISLLSYFKSDNPI